MKTKEEWLNEMKNECAHGEPCTPMLERISMIQNDALEGAMLPNELVEENDRLLAENSNLQSMIDKCAEWSSLPSKIISLQDELDRLRADNARLVGEVESICKPKMYPIQKGPSVPWEVMVPHESRCQKNHGQSIKRIAERGGFSSGEAYCIVNNLDWYEMEKTIGWQEADRRWVEYAEKINNHYAELDRLRADNARLVCELEREQEDHQALVEEAQRVEQVRLAGLQRHKDALAAARVALERIADYPKIMGCEQLGSSGQMRSIASEALTTINEVLGSK